MEIEWCLAPADCYLKYKGQKLFGKDKIPALRFTKSEIKVKDKIVKSLAKHSFDKDSWIEFGTDYSGDEAILTFVSKNKECFDMAADKIGDIKIYDISTNKKNTHFLALVVDQSGMMLPTTSFYLVGKYGDTYVPYVTMESLRNMGVQNNEFVRVDCRDDKLYLDIYEKRVNNIGSFTVLTKMYVLDWDNDAQWFSIRRAPMY